MENQTKTCRQCGREMHGRSDKKYCNDDCRNIFNNTKHQHSETPYVKGITSTLRKNRKVLLTIAPANRNWIIVSQVVLTRLGFNFYYHTHSTPIGSKILTCCFEVGYFHLENSNVLIIRTAKLPENRKMDIDMRQV